QPRSHSTRQPPSHSGSHQPPPALCCFTSAASPSACVTISSSNFSPNPQNAGSVTSMPSRPTSTCGASDPPAASISRYFATNAAPSCSYFWTSASTSSSPKE